jgi:peptide/nickel transport system substrate-binding protein
VIRLTSHRVAHTIGLSLVAVSLLLAACGGAPASPTSAQPAATEAPGAGMSGGTLTLAAKAIVNVDPAQISADSEILVANAVYDYLVDVDAGNKIEPRLATDWSVSDDGLTYTFNLTHDATFHDGTPLTSKDVVYTFDRLRNPDLGFATADLYGNIADIQAEGDYSVVFTLKDTNPFFLFDLSDNHALVVKDGTTDFTDFNGSGPFQVASYTPEDRVEMDANPDYFQSGMPQLEHLNVVFFQDTAAAVDALRSGDVDAVFGLSAPQYKTLQGESGVETYLTPTNAFPVVRLRADQPPGDDPRVIQAMRMAIDRQAIFDLVQQGLGAVGRDTPIGPMYQDYYADDIPLPEHDVEGAKKLLADAGYPDGLDLTLRLPDAQNFPDLAAVLKSQLGEAGFNIEVSVEPENVYYGNNGWLEAPFGITGWGSRPYPQFYMDVMLTCGAKWNESHFCDKPFDDQAQIAGTSLDPDAQVAAYHEIQKILIERGPVIVPFFFPQLAATSDKVHNFDLKPFYGRTDFRAVTVAQ